VLLFPSHDHAVSKIWDELGEELVITSALEGQHSPGSLHFYGLALDFRTRYFSEYEAQQAFVRLTEALPDFIIVLEETHIHVQSKDY
jgi:hypothetical protein